MRFRVGHQYSQFWPILAHFVEYYSLFLGPRAISTIDDPRDPLTCPSSTHTNLADSGLFRGLLLTVLLFESDFHGSRTPSCAYVSIINNRSLGQSRPVSWTITQFWGPGVIFTVDEPRGTFTCR